MPEKPLNFQSSSQFAGLKAGQSLAPSVEPSSAEPISASDGTCTEAEPFALQVQGDSMAPEFRNGCIVIIDPSVAPVDGSFVIADCGVHGYLLRELTVSNGVWHLKTLATQDDPQTDPQIKIAPDQSAILGVVIQQSGTRRSATKHY